MFFSFAPQAGKNQGARAGHGGHIVGAGIHGSGLPGVYFGSDISKKEKKALLKKVKDVAYIPGKRPSQLSNTSSGSSFTPDTPISK